MAVEKSLKGLLALFDQDTPKIHDLPRLYAMVTGKIALEWDIQVLDAVNEFYIETRYPLHEDQSPVTISRTQLGRMLGLAERATDRLDDEVRRMAVPESEADSLPPKHHPTAENGIPEHPDSG